MKISELALQNIIHQNFMTVKLNVEQYLFMIDYF